VGVWLVELGIPLILLLLLWRVWPKEDKSDDRPRTPD
jgi:hypothetical protein